MTTVDGFPRALLAQPPAARLAYFVGKVVAHPRLVDAHRALLAALRQPTPAPLILVVGPTGVGKTTLRRRIERQLVAEALPELADDPGRIPVVALEAVAPESGQFHWKDYYTRALLALDEPLLAHKIDVHARGLRREGDGAVVVERGTAAPELRRALEHCLRQRRPTAVLVDEAQHLRKTASARRLLDHMDLLKSLAGMTGTPHVLLGTYDLLGLVDLSAQLSRRSADIHFGRYRAGVAEDARAFKSVLLTFQRHLPLATEPDLVGRWEALYEQSVGCVGVLKNWLERALAAALAAGASTLSARCLQEQAMPTRKLLSLVRELKEGEEALAAGERGRGELRALLGLAPERARPDAAATAAEPAPAPGRVRARSPGGRAARRRPERDPVGVGVADGR
jgi:hypothetical protein